MRVAFLHPDLGVGGAERLIVDAAVGLQERGHSVTVFTNHRDVGHCFPEARDGTLDVVVLGSWLPGSLFGRGKVLCATLRMLYAAVVMAVFYPRPEVAVLDQVATAVWLLRWAVWTRVVFYCHFPDLLLAPASPSPLRRLYRAPFDALEEAATVAADVVLVNSEFTGDTVMATFPSMRTRPDVLYPAINVDAIDAGMRDAVASPRNVAENTTFFSINRFERKKGIQLAVYAFAKVYAARAATSPGLALVLAGGYDPNNTENAEYFAELQDLVASLGLPDGVVTFAPSISNEEKYAYLDAAAAVLYTPANEHFGIVPVEAMYAQRPVIAVNSGGPTESIVDGVTGFLVDNTPDAFAQAMLRVLDEPGDREEMGREGRNRVVGNYVLSAFAARLEEFCQQAQRA